MSTIKQGGQTLVTVCYDGVGPSGETTFYDNNGQPVQAPDYGSIVLIGTQSNPIEINGPVIIPSDVIIRGYVKGQGTIYSGRNIHIVGDIKYVNPPSWSNRSTENTDNKNKDMVGLMAKGNIVLGDYTSWASDLYNIMTSTTYVPTYKCDTSDAAIGYPQKFNDTTGTRVHYQSVEQVGSAYFAQCQAAGLADFVPGGRDSGSGQFGKNRGETARVVVGSHKETQSQKVKVGQREVQRWSFFRGYYTEYEDIYEWQNVEVDVDDYATRPKTSYNRKYYESVCNDSVIKNNLEKDGRSTKAITQIDAILYNNHTICGRVGACSFNGALVCRNEAIRYSGGLYMNWDIRLYTGSSETVDNDKVGLAKSSDNPPQVIDWREIPEGVVSFD